MKRIAIFWLILCALAGAARGSDSPLPPGEKPQNLGNVGAGEGPAWHPGKGLFFTGGGDRISRRDLDGKVTVFREPSGGANGNVFDLQGRMVTCESARRRVTRTELNGTITVLTDRYQNQRYNSPNDVCVDSLGRIYFTDPRYGPRDDMEMKDADGRLV